RREGRPGGGGCPDLRDRGDEDGERDHRAHLGHGQRAGRERGRRDRYRRHHRGNRLALCAWHAPSSMPPRHHLKAVLPLVLATTATQASIVVLAPIVVAIGHSFHASVSAVGQGRTVLAGTAVLAALVVGPMIDRIGVRPLIVWGSALAIAGA